MILDICVVVPARNEATVIEATLRSLIAAGVPAVHIYLVDDCSSDGTGDIGRKLGVIVLRNDPNLGKAHAIARVVDTFKLDERFPFIALMDADTIVNEGYFAAMRKAFEDPEVVTACGRPKSRPYNWITAYRAYGYAFTHFVYRGAQSKMRVINVAPGCSTTYRSSIWRKLDWNKDTMVEDMDVTIQIQKYNYGRIVYVPEAVVYTQDPQTLADYGKQMNRWHTGTWQVIVKHKLYGFRRKIDWECSFLFGEGLLYSLLYLLLPLLLLYDTRFGYMALLDAGLAFAIAIFVAAAERRKDVLLSAPLFPLIRVFDAWLFVSAFWKVIIRRQAVTTWFTPARYKQENL
jgi:cellulose synthase/poly-beta-1,6-N-acetylglucosamine synthase-like glycosyltransferase